MSKNLNFLHYAVARWDGLRRPPSTPIDWNAALRAERSCCCPAKPVVMVIMPPAAGRAHQTDLLLCGHHYRVCRQALAAAGATVTKLDAIQPDDGAWPLGRVSA